MWSARAWRVPCCCWRGRTDDHLVEITLTTMAAYGAFLLADHFAMSGVLATLAAGLVIGNVGWRGAISPAGREPYHLLLGFRRVFSPIPSSSS